MKPVTSPWVQRAQRGALPVCVAQPVQAYSAGTRRPAALGDVLRRTLPLAERRPEGVA